MHSFLPQLTQNWIALLWFNFCHGAFLSKRVIVSHICLRNSLGDIVKIREVGWRY